MPIFAPMLQISYIRQNSQDVISRLKVKNFSETNVVDEIIATDDELRKIKQETETRQSQIKKLSEEIGMLIRKGNADEAESKKKEVEPFKNDVASLSITLESLDKKL